MFKIKRITIKRKINVIDLLCGLLTLLIFFYLEYIYKNFVFRYYDYTGFTYHFSWGKYLTGKIIFLSALYLTYKVSREDLLFPVLFFILLFYAIPNIIMFEMSDVPLVMVLGILVFMYFVLLFSGIKWKMPKQYLPDTTKFYVLLILAVLMLVPFFVAYGFSINWKVFLLKDVYVVRLASRVKATLLTSYLYSSLSKIVFPLMMIYGLSKKDYILLVVSVVGILYLFAVLAAKIVLFGMFVSLFFFFGKSYRIKIFYFLLALTGIFLTGRFFTVIMGTLAPESIFIRREFFLPAYLNQVYYDFFSTHPHVFWSNSILGPFLHPVYSTDPAFLIGKEYFGDVNTSANNGIISDGYMNMGVAGMVFTVALAAVIVAFINAAKTDNRYLGLYFIMVATFISSPLFTGLLTHGMILLILLSVFLLRSDPTADSITPKRER